MSKVKTHYNIDKIDERGASINIIWGERANGKSYQVKHKKAIIPYLEDSYNYYDSYINKGEIIKTLVKAKRRFILMRRWREEISPYLIEKYFDDVDIEKLTDGKYNSISVWRSQIYLANYDIESNKMIKGEVIGYVVALSTEQKYAGGSFLDVTDIIFEEFMSRGLYLSNEADKLMNFYSTIDRKRGTTKLWLVGNSISKVCPYLIEWGLLDIINNMKQGEIKELWLSTGDVDENGNNIEVKIALEYCNPTGDSSFVIGKHKNMLNKGEWQSDPQPHLPKSYNLYKVLYRILFIYKGFKFLGEFLLDSETHYTTWFIKSYKGEIKENTLIFSDIISPSPYYQRDIYNPLINNKKLKDLLYTFKESNICYSDDLTGTDFKQAIDFEIRK